jgi:hypothetical protein
MSLGEDFWAYLATLKKIGRIVLQSSGHPDLLVALPVKS